MRYAKSRLEQEKRDLAYRVFMTDLLGHLVGLKVRYIDIINPPPAQETESPEEIIGGLKAKLAKMGGE